MNMKISDSTPLGAPSPKLGRLLVVDDEVPLMTALCEMLTKQGFEAVGFASGREALEALHESEFDLLLSDLMMLDMDGIELLRAAREIDPHLVGLIMTGQGTVQTAVEAMKTGAFDYLLKPFKLSVVLPILSRALDVRRLRMENVQLRGTMAIYELSQTIAFTLDLNTILNKTADAALQQCEADEASILLPTPEGNELYVAAVRGEGREHILGQRLSLEAGIAGWVAHHRESLILQGEVQDTRFASLHPRPDIHSAISLPMLAGNQLVGVLNVNATRRRRRFTLGQVKALTILISAAASGLENARLYEAVQQELVRRRQAEDELRAAEVKYRTLVEQIPAITYIAEPDPHGHTFFISPQVKALLGFTADEWLADTEQWLKQLHPDDRERTLAEMRHTQVTGEPLHSDYRMLTRDGRTLWFNDEAVLVRDEAGRPQFIQGVMFDITERKQRERELEAIAAVSVALRTAQTRTEMLPVILDQLLSLLKAEAAALDMGDPATGEAVTELGCGEWASFTGRRTPTGEGITGHVITTGQPYQNNDVRSDPRFYPPALLGGIQAVACAPLSTHQQTIGALWIGRKTPILPTEVRLLTAIADIAANAIQRETLHEQTERRLENLAALRAIDMAISSSLDLRLTLDVLLDQVISQLRVDAADVLLLNPHTHTLEYAAGRGFRSRGPEGSNLQLGQGYPGRAALERRTISLPDLADEEPDLARSALLAGEGFQAYYGVPLIVKGLVEGVLEIFHRSPLHPGSDWLDFLEALAGQAAIAIDNTQLFDKLQRSNLNLSLAYDATIEGWSRALDLRDKETEGHTQRVTEVTLKLARAMGMPEEELMHVRRGALLHDIGKMGIPDGILLKPGPLIDEEWVIMRKHPRYAYELLSPITYLRPALDIPYCHHEKWDGTGYPRGLKGEQIPPMARIFAMADVWDALLSDRPYRAAWPEEKVREHIRALAGTHFDPRVVEVFLSLDDEGSTPTP